MVTLRMQHTVQDFAEWKAMFDADPLDRKGSGVLTYRVQSSPADPGLAFIDLEFGGREEADQFLERLRALSQGAGASTILKVDAWVLDTVESGTL
jgi:hypothetical protein